MYWLNGHPADSISLLDRSFQYGDGCFTTMLTKQGKLVYWSYHLQRMQACLDALAIPHPDWAQVKNWLDLAATGDSLAGLKLHISRGEGGRGYSATQVSTPNVTISNFAYPAHYRQWQEQGIELGVCTTRLGINPLLAGHKHNNRLEQILVKAELDQRKLVDGIVLNFAGDVIETSMANLFWWQGEQLCTPNLEASGVAGVARRRVLEFAEQQAIDVQIGSFELVSLLNADEVFITNSLLGVAPIKAIEGHRFPIGAMTRSIQEMLSP
ncbi:aminodeoxychorismate lyase [Vibrio sp. 404]|uniref:Aminodeoxychorismate lyase n=1 Tax=Vibrio marinisediminis TaxID=2758441 RepID=A0A7W2FPH9_9VIBR|nr:aminodeoxychorismate lyase [Vibrio marinisediminis]